MLYDIPNAQLSWSTFRKEQGSGSFLHPLDNIQAILKVKKVLRSESMPIADDLQKSRQLQDQSGSRCFRISNRSFSCLKLSRQVKLVVPKN